MFLRLSRRIYWIYREVLFYSYLHHLMKRSGFMRCRYGRTVGRYLRKLGVRAKKNGIPLYPNLVNLKSNTMKNTMQRYGLLGKLQENRLNIFSKRIIFSVFPFILLSALDTNGIFILGWMVFLVI